VLARSGQLLTSWQCSRDYGFTDYDGRRPDWGRLAIDFSGLPPSFVDMLRTGSELQLAWLNSIAANTLAFSSRIPTVRKARRKTRQAV